METKTTLIRRAKERGLAFQWVDELLYIPSTSEEIADSVDAIASCTILREEYDFTGLELMTYHCSCHQGDFMVHLPDFAVDYAKQICERFYHATNGAHPEDECQDRWQENLRIYMLDVCCSAEVDPCSIIMSIHNTKNN